MLLTCDRKLAEFRNAPGRVVVLPSNDLSAQASALSAQLSIDLLHRPFSRCLLCNGAVEAADPVPGSARNALPADAAGPITRCSVCEKLYWQGSHTARMRARLERWATGDFTV